MPIRFPTVDKLYSYVDRGLIGILAGFLSFYLLRAVSLPDGINYFVTALIVVSSVILAGLMPVILLVAAIILQFLKNYTVLGTYVLGKPSVEFLVASISSFILLIIVPTVNYAKFVDLSSYVISMGIIASIIGPNVNYFLVNFPILLGITFFATTQKKTTLISAIISPLPLFSLILLNLYSPDRFYIIAAVILLEISSVIGFALNNGAAMVSAVPAIVSALLFSNSFSYSKTLTLLSSVLATAGIAIYVGYSYAVAKSVYSNELKLKKKSLTDDLQETLKGLKDLETMKNDNFPITNSVEMTIAKIEDIKKRTEECSTPKCVDELRTEMEASIKSVSNYINDVIFEKIIAFNNVAEELKSKGLVIEKIEIPKDEFKIDSNLTYSIQRIISKIEMEYNSSAQVILKIADKLKEITGLEMQNEIRVLPSMDKLPSLYDKVADPVVMEKINSCLDNLLVLLQNINEMKPEKERDTDIFKSIIDSKQLNGINKINYSYDTIKRGLTYVQNFIKNLIQESTALTTAYPFLNDVININVVERIQQTLYDQGVPMCRKVTLLSSSIKILEDLSLVVRYKEYVRDLNGILNNVTKELLSDGKECVPLAELGIRKDLAPLIRAKIKENGNGVSLRNDSICRGN
ncbi:hypothetical protein [Sulfuracidifex metallicus]|uniref:Uncharacterized protein n=1 Tax=Sulfuracidifex metallicus DSM 6482 = JCM 9184 TaxID=523847 RepID=A0A6A9QJF1_SULME|nr:hypothetical protein [Sulfuracidifex metallicus]MUN28370.1 hypothetical protein [Sulfuracidifex metallicus DSM 6482 = JCM 9184]WOE51111.1 hypothetical protein RQ359_000354 [Sulfuracidifex metallicus DSM 6482 = JCM 9184]